MSELWSFYFDLSAMMKQTFDVQLKVTVGTRCPMAHHVAVSRCATCHIAIPLRVECRGWQLLPVVTVPRLSEWECG